MWKDNVAQKAQEAGCPSTVPVLRPVWKGHWPYRHLQKGSSFHTLAEMRKKAGKPAVSISLADIYRYEINGITV